MILTDNYKSDKYLAIAAIMRQEEPYLEEWCKYHKALGVDGIVLWNNEPEIRSAKDWWLWFRDLGINYVAIYDIATRPGQMEAYKQYIELNNKHYNYFWSMLIDIDEMIVVKDPVRDLRSILRTYEEFAAVYVHWELFGSNGYEFYSDKPVTEKFTRSEPDVNPHVKGIIQTRYTTEPKSPHCFTHTIASCDENYIRIEPGEEKSLYENGSCNLLQVNHYAVKSKEECLKRRLQPRSDTGEVRDAETFFKSHDRNEVEDLTARDFYRSIK